MSSAPRILTHNHANLTLAVFIVAGDHRGHRVVHHRHHIHLKVLPRGREVAAVGPGVSIQPARGRSSPTREAEAPS